MTSPSDQTQPVHTNRLSRETSPYLLQHQHNPVDWHPWGEEAFEKARLENKPLLISIGYSACHWCHVMERESFENEEIAQLINDTVIPVKVDREERPDVDAIYMNACVAMTGQGGWPLNAFVTPKLEPFFVGTYFPPDDKWGRAGFKQVLNRIREAWLTEKDDITSQAGLLQKQIEQYQMGARHAPIDEDIFTRAVNEAASSFDMHHGGFGGAPKFPPDQRLALLLAAWYDTDSRAALEMTTKTLLGMGYGGMYDQLGGGFSRYSVDAEWLIPHFEKMLYNQALLVPVYLDAFLATDNSEFARISGETLDWVLRDLRAPEGVFYSALDADSEGEEGKFYVWKPDEVVRILGEEDAKLFCEYYDVSSNGNFEHGTSALRITTSPAEFASKHNLDPAAWNSRLASMKSKMLTVRDKRVPPGTDDKALTSWNGLMISAYCRGYQVLGHDRYLAAAKTAADFILTRQWKDSTLLRSYCKGESRINGVLDDYAFFTGALIDLYETTLDQKYLDAARQIADTMIERFVDKENSGFYFTSGEDKSLISRTKDLHDGALPSGSSMAVMNVLRLAAFYDNAEYRALGLRSIEAAGSQVNRVTSAFGSLLLAYRYLQESAPQIVIAGDASDLSVQQMLQTVWKAYLPTRIIAFADGKSNLPIAKDKSSSSSLAFVCHNYTCDAPAKSAAELAQQLKQLRPGQ